MDTPINQTRNRFVLAIDEAGALGYTDHDEKEPGEFGLAGGVLYPENAERHIQAMVERAAFQARSGYKLHITDMPVPEQERLRQFLDDLVAGEALWLFYSAVSAAGYHLEYRRRREAAAKANAARKSKIKISGGDRSDPDRLLEEVYRDVVFDAIAWCNDEYDGDYQLTVRSDRTEEEILSRLETSVLSLLQPEHNEITRGKGFDPATKKVIEGGRVSVEWKMPDSFGIKCTRENLKVDLTPLATEMALLPDTLVNWISHLLGALVARNPDARLNEKAALKDFPLAGRIYRFTQKVPPHVADTLLGRKQPLDRVNYPGRPDTGAAGAEDEAAAIEPG